MLSMLLLVRMLMVMVLFVEMLSSWLFLWVLGNFLCLIMSPFCLSVMSGMMDVFFLSFLMGLVWLKVFNLFRLSLIRHEAINLFPLLIRGGVFSNFILIIRHGNG